MTDFHKAIVAFWGDLGLPVYMQGKAPQNAVFPFVTLNISQPETFRECTESAFVWLKDDGTGVNAKRCGYIDKVRQMIPAQGALIKVGSGYALLSRNDLFVSYRDDPTDNDIYGAAIYYKVRLFE